MRNLNQRLLVFAAVVACLAGLLRAEEDYCVGVPSGFLCVAGVTDKFYECNGPFYQGWRECGAGARCVRVGHFATNPCSAPSGSDGRNSSTTPGLPAPAESTGAEPAGLSWVLWLCVGVASTVVVGAAVGGLVWAARKRQARRRKNGALPPDGGPLPQPPCSP